MPRYTRNFFYHEFNRLTSELQALLTDPDVTKRDVLDHASAVDRLYDDYIEKWNNDVARYDMFREFEKRNKADSERRDVEQMKLLVEEDVEYYLERVRYDSPYERSSSKGGATAKGETEITSGPEAKKKIEIETKQEKDEESSKEEKLKKKALRRKKFIDEIAESLKEKMEIEVLSQFRERLPRELGRRESTPFSRRKPSKWEKYRYDSEEESDFSQTRYTPRLNLSDRLHGFRQRYVKSEKKRADIESDDEKPIQGYVARVELPTFDGKDDFTLWWSTFETLVDKSKEPVTIKFLRLRQQLKGEPYKMIAHFPHDEDSYELAKEKLLDHYGGEQRNLYKLYNEAATVDKVERDDDLSGLRTLSCLVLKLIRCLSVTSQSHETGRGALSFMCTAKLPSSLIMKYHEWRERTNQDHTLISLSDFLEENIARRVTALETVYPESRKAPKKTPRTMMNDRSTKEDDGSNMEAPTVNHTSGKKKDNSNGGVPRSSGKKCRVCQGTHWIWDCSVFKSYTVDQKWKKVKELRLCFRCLSFRHGMDRCDSSRLCGVNKCAAKHHRLLHDEERFQKYLAEKNKAESGAGGEAGPSASAPPASSGNSDGSNVNVVLDQKSYSSRYLALRTVPVAVIVGNSRTIANALLDDGSSLSFVNKSLADKAGLVGIEYESEVQVFEGNKVRSSTMLVELTIESLDGKHRYTDMAELTDKVVGNMEVVNWNYVKSQWSHLADIEFPCIDASRRVDILLGANYMDLIASIQDVPGSNPEDPQARLTKLGWTCVGRYPIPLTQSVHYVNKISSVGDEDLCQAVERLWEWQEVNPSRTELTYEEKSAERQVEATIKKIGKGYQVTIPWKGGEQPTFPCDNFDQAFRKLITLEKRLLKHENRALAMINIFQEYIDAGYFELIDRWSGVDGKRWYLTFFEVVRDSPTSPVRPVYNASLKYLGVCLNDAELPGPKYQQDIIKVLLRFRLYAVAIGSDISKMYFQVFLDEMERDFQRILWRGLKQDEEVKVYRGTRVMFGRKSSPYLALKVSVVNANLHQDQYPMAAETVKKSTYMDDSLDSTRDASAAIKLKDELLALWGEAGMTPRKWFSNSAEVMETIPQDMRAQKLDILRCAEAAGKTLGMLYLAFCDVLSYSIKIEWDAEFVTKRKFLKLIAGLFDPLGLIAPVLIRGRTLLQELWMLGLDWDEEVVGSVLSKINAWVLDIQNLSSIKVSRVLIRKMEALRELHCCCDASLLAYGACLYFVIRYLDGDIDSRLVFAKGRVAPVHAISTPRLELQGAVVATECVERVQETLGVEDDNVHYWCDSMDVVFWVKALSRNYKPFVANRIGTIQSRSSPKQWKYIPTQDNPADLLSRGLDVSKLEDNRLWWHGAEFFAYPEMWPQKKVPEKINDKELRSSRLKFSMHVVLTTRKVHYRDVLSLISRCSRWMRLLRIIGYMLRFSRNAILKGSMIENRVSGVLKCAELADAEDVVVKAEQAKFYGPEVAALQKSCSLPSSSKIRRYSPWMDDDGVMRSRTRLQNAECLEWETRNPMIIPRHGEVIKMIMRHIHEKNHHIGLAQILGKFRLKYIALADREAARGVCSECIVCKKERQKPYMCPMADLPTARVKILSRAFQKTSMDMAGPFETMQGRGKTRQKRWLCLFCCLVTRAVHLEMAYQMDTDDFLLTLDRFTHARGVPDDLYADNGTNFVGGRNEYEEMKRTIDFEQIESKMAADGMKWHFQPPSAPHFGGSHESLVKLAKKQLYRILKNSDVRDSELLTAIKKTEGILNSRPLTYSSDPNEEPPVLTPGNFIHGLAQVDVTPRTTKQMKLMPSRLRWHRVDELMTHFWQRFKEEWLVSLSPRSKWFQTYGDIEVGDLVLVPEMSETYGHWPIGRITKVYPGNDGQIRVVDVQVRNRVFRRPIVKLCPLLKE